MKKIDYQKEREDRIKFRRAACPEILGYFLTTDGWNSLNKNGEVVVIPQGDMMLTPSFCNNARKLEELLKQRVELLGACKSALRALEDNLRPGPLDADAKTALRLIIAKTEAY